MCPKIAVFCTPTTGYWTPPDNTKKQHRTLKANPNPHPPTAIPTSTAPSNCQSASWRNRRVYTMLATYHHSSFSAPLSSYSKSMYVWAILPKPRQILDIMARFKKGFGPLYYNHNEKIEPPK